MRRLIVYQDAVAEIETAHRWYEAQREGLGQQFESELRAVLERVARTPLVFPVEIGDYRRAKLRLFPYLVFFTHDDDSVRVNMALHAARNPELRRRRLK